MSETTFELLRPADLLVARVTLHNLTLHFDRVTRINVGDPVGISITLPPQHFRESVGIGVPPGLAAAAPSRIDLGLPADVTSMPLGPNGLWGLCETLTIAGTATLAVPTHVDLVPRDAHWSLAPRPQSLDQCTDLWRARLDGPTHETGILGRFLIRDVHQSDVLAWDVPPTQEQLHSRYLAGIMVATRFDLTDLGCVVGGVDGKFGDDTGVPVTEFKTHMGRSPTAPVVGPGTLGARDGFLAHEPDRLSTVDDDVTDPELIPTEADISGTTGFLFAADLAHGSPDPGNPGARRGRHTVSGPRRHLQVGARRVQHRVSQRKRVHRLRRAPDDGCAAVVPARHRLARLIDHGKR